MIKLSQTTFSHFILCCTWTFLVLSDFVFPQSSEQVWFSPLFCIVQMWLMWLRSMKNELFYLEELAKPWWKQRQDSSSWEEIMQVCLSVCHYLVTHFSYRSMRTCLSEKLKTGVFTSNQMYITNLKNQKQNKKISADV